MNDFTKELEEDPTYIINPKIPELKNGLITFTDITNPTLDIINPKLTFGKNNLVNFVLDEQISNSDTLLHSRLTPTILNEVETQTDPLSDVFGIIPNKTNSIIEITPELTFGKKNILDFIHDEQISNLEYSYLNPSQTFSIIPTEFEPPSDVPTELDNETKIQVLEKSNAEKDEIIQQLQRKVSKLEKREKRNSRKIDDVRIDVHDTTEFMVRKFNHLSADVEVLAALHDDDDY